jgi:hypothetical protein
VSHLADWGEADASGAFARWSPSLLLYSGREAGDLMSGVVDCDGDATAGFVAVDRSSIVLCSAGEHSAVQLSRLQTLGKEGCGREMCGSGRGEGSLYELDESER